MEVVMVIWLSLLTVVKCKPSSGTNLQPSHTDETTETKVSFTQGIFKKVKAWVCEMRLMVE